MKKVFSFTLTDLKDTIKDNAYRGRKSLVLGHRMAFAVEILLNFPLVYKVFKGRIFAFSGFKNLERKG